MSGPWLVPADVSLQLQRAYGIKTSTHTNELKIEMAQTVTRKKSLKNEITKGCVNSLSHCHKPE